MQIGVIAFDDDVEYPDDSCYGEGLALATSVNQDKLKHFVASIEPSQTTQVNYSKAFSEAFRLLAAAGNNSDSTTNNTKRCMKTFNNNNNKKIAGDMILLMSQNTMVRLCSSSIMVKPCF